MPLKDDVIQILQSRPRQEGPAGQEVAPAETCPA
jgi:hypothetical protein